jgi:hypothetical protein
MNDCTNLAVNDRVCINNEAVGSVVRVLSKYVEVKPVVGPLRLGYTRKYFRRDGFEWGVGAGSWGINMIEPWDEEKHAPAVALHDLKLARMNIGVHVSRRANKLSLEQINEIKEILLKAEGE